MSETTKKTLSADYETRSFQIPAYRLSGIQGRLEALSKQAQKLGLPAFDIKIGDLFYVKDTKTEILQQFYPLTVTGGVPKIDGWRFAVKLEHHKNPDPDSKHAYLNLVSGYRADTLVQNDPDVFDKLAFCDPDCDHCKTNRNRNTTFLFENDESGELVQVGSTCVNDFAGHSDPLLLASAAQWPLVVDELRSISEDGFDMNEGRSFTGFEPARVLAAGAAVLREQGFWKSRDNCPHGIGSAGDVEYLLSKPADYDRVVKSDDVRVAGDIVEWLTSDTFDPDGSTYLNNLSVMARTGHVPVTKIGLMGSGVAAWSRQNQTANARDSMPLADIKLGRVDEKLEIEAVVEKVIPVENHYGVSYLHLFRDTDTNARLTWFNSGTLTLCEGDTYQLKGTVKAHTFRDGISQTQLTRVSAPAQKPLKHLDWGHGSLSRDFSFEKFTKQFPKKDPQIAVRDKSGSTALHYLSRNYWIDAEDQEGTSELRQAIDWLLERGAKPGQVDFRGERPIDGFIYSRDEALVRACLDAWPDCVDHMDLEKVKRDLVDTGEGNAEMRIGEMVLAARSERMGNQHGAASAPSENSASSLSGLPSGLTGSFAPEAKEPDDDELEFDSTLRLA